MDEDVFLLISNFPGADTARKAVRLLVEERLIACGNLITEEFTMDHCTWHDEAGEPFEVTVKIRYAHPGAAATVFPGENGEARVRLHVPARALPARPVPADQHPLCERQ